MSRLKNEILILQSGHPLLPYIFLWRRYVDNILYVWTRLEYCPQGSLQHMNSMYPYIKFTTGIGRSKINFLELPISLLPNGYPISMYRKDIAIDILINGWAFCLFLHKLAAFNSFIRSLVSLPLSPDAYNTKVSIIQHRVYVKSINSDINGLIRKKLELLPAQLYPSPTKTSYTRKNVLLPFLFHSTSKIGQVFNTIPFI